jgi:DNA-binding response OmpR family regulator
VVVLVVEDEPGIARFVRRGLESAGFTVEVAVDGPSGLAAADRDDIALVILDLGLPGMAGEEVLVRLRRSRPALPVIVLTAKDAVADRVANLDAGADDYLVKPFSFAELLARVRARLRSPDQPSGVLLEAAGLRLDLRTRQVSIDGGRGEALSAREFALLELLMRHPGQILSQTQLLDLVWGYDFDGASNVVETYIRHLRRKLGADRIQTVRRAGYRLLDP